MIFEQGILLVQCKKGIFNDTLIRVGETLIKTQAENCYFTRPVL